MTAPSSLTTLALDDEGATIALGDAVASGVLALCEAVGFPDEGLTIHLSGDLGAGKTTLARALLRRLGVTGRIKSPTFTLVEPYVVGVPQPAAAEVESRLRMNLNCYHFDFYRFEDPHEWLDAGFRDYFSDAALRLVEWPERARSSAGTLLPAPDVHIVLAVRDAGRTAELAAFTEHGASWLSAIALAPEVARRLSPDVAG